MHCPEHPKYKGTSNIQRLTKCIGCRKVRQTYLAGMQERKNRGKGSQFSITTPGFRCGIGHLLAELGTVMLYGQQPSFFWRIGTQSDPRAKEHYKKIYNYLGLVLSKDKDLLDQIKGLLWKIWEADYHKLNRDKEHQQSMQLAFDEAHPARIEDTNLDLDEARAYLSNVHINPLLHGDEDGKEEEN